jgi:O-antigen/teichoic acid export membrane protein
VIKIVGGEDFEPAGTVLRIQASALAFVFVSYAASFALLSVRRHREILLAALVTFLVGIGLSFALIPPLGARGAAIATVAAEIAQAVAMTAFAARSGVGIRLGRLPALALLAAGVGVAIPVLLGVNEVAGVVIATGIYAGVLALAGEFPHDVRRALVEAIPLPRRT